jgi:hypothetical protein
MCFAAPLRLQSHRVTECTSLRYANAAGKVPERHPHSAESLPLEKPTHDYNLQNVEPRPGWFKFMKSTKATQTNSNYPR